VQHAQVSGLALGAEQAHSERASVFCPATGPSIARAGRFFSKKGTSPFTTSRRCRRLGFGGHRLRTALVPQTLQPGRLERPWCGILGQPLNCTWCRRRMARVGSGNCLKSRSCRLARAAVVWQMAIVMSVTAGSDVIHKTKRRWSFSRSKLAPGAINKIKRRRPFSRSKLAPVLGTMPQREARQLASAPDQACARGAGWPKTRT